METRTPEEPSRSGPPARWAVDVGIVVLATLAWFHATDSAPGGYQEDFSSLALNAFCLTISGADEYGERLPIVAFRSFGDYKGTLNLYPLALVFQVFGPGLQTARVFSIALSFAATAMNLVYLRFSGALPRIRAPFVWTSVFALLLLSPWNLVTHRVLLEVTITYVTVSLVVVSAGLLLKRTGSIGYGLLHGAAVGLLAYCYSPAKVVYVIHFPLLLAVLALHPPLGLSKVFRMRGLLVAVAVAGLMGLPQLWDLLHSQHSLARFHQVGGHFGGLDNLRSFFDNFSVGFLFLHGDSNLHHHSGYRGMLNLFFLPLLAGGIVALVLRCLGKDKSAFWTYVLLLLPLCFVPATLAQRSEPHALRTNIALVPITFVSLYGLQSLETLLVARLGRKRALALFVGWTLFGFFEATRSLDVFFHQYAQRNLWSYTRPKPRWNTADLKPSYDDHTPETVHERFYRAVDQRDYEYCRGYEGALRDSGPGRRPRRESE